MIRPQSAAVAFIGCCTLLLCAFQGLRTTRFLNHATRTSGIIAEAAAHPRIRFETAEGTVVEFVQNGFVSRPQGSRVPVAYDPAIRQVSLLSRRSGPCGAQRFGDYLSGSASPFSLSQAPRFSGADAESLVQLCLQRLCKQPQPAIEDGWDFARISDGVLRALECLDVEVALAGQVGLGRSIRYGR